MACSIDIGVTKDGRTLLIECNDAYSLGAYGLVDYKYAKLLSARWSQLLEREDVFVVNINKTIMNIEYARLANKASIIC